MLFSGARLPLHERLLTGLRFLLKENQLPLNRNGAAGWFDGERLWLVSKWGIDALRDHLTGEGHTGIPSRNDWIFDELQQYKVLIPHRERAVWTVSVAGDDWSHTLTCLCFPAARIWPDPESRPEVFAGMENNWNRRAGKWAGRSSNYWIASSRRKAGA